MLALRLNRPSGRLSWRTQTVEGRVGQTLTDSRWIDVDGRRWRGQDDRRRLSA